MQEARDPQDRPISQSPALSVFASGDWAVASNTTGLSDYEAHAICTFIARRLLRERNGL